MKINLYVKHNGYSPDYLYNELHESFQVGMNEFQSLVETSDDIEHIKDRMLKLTDATKHDLMALFLRALIMMKCNHYLDSEIECVHYQLLRDICTTTIKASGEDMKFRFSTK